MCMFFFFSLSCFILFGDFLFSFLVLIIWFAFWKLHSTIWHYPAEICLKADLFFSFAFWFGRSRNTARLNFPEYVYFPDEYLLWLSWKTSDQTSCRVVRASALIRLEKPRSALKRPWVNRSALVLHGKPRQIKYTQYDICRCVCICVEVIQDRNMWVLMTG